MEHRKKTNLAKELLDDYLERTGITADKKSSEERYLWTDALAVQTLLGLFRNTYGDNYRKKAEDLIASVHQHLGKHHPSDEREGWISGLIAEKGELHPTVGGLRIGKKNPERTKNETFHPQEEWERDGQYFHYNTKWIMALLKAEKETGEKQYLKYALELLLASAEFIYQQNNSNYMYWKMNAELTCPLVPSMGLHDPLEGILCAKSLEQALPEKVPEINQLCTKFTAMTENAVWETADPLGIGSLLLNTITASRLSQQEVDLPPAAHPKKLFQESLSGLQKFKIVYLSEEPATRRLAFRECGLSLGIKSLLASQNEVTEIIPGFEELKKYLPLAEEIENFWLRQESRRSSTWSDHLNINAVTLAASLSTGGALL